MIAARGYVILPLMNGKEKNITRRAVIASDFAQTISACVEELLPAGHIGIAFEMADAALADDISAALGVQKFKISRFSFADGTLPSHEAAGDIISAPESIRLLICASNNIADVVKYAASRRGIEWIFCPSGPDILPYAGGCAVLGWGAWAERLPARPPAAIAADRGRMERALGREKAAAYASFYAERLHCKEIECENLLFGRRSEDTSALADICAAALKEGDNLADYSLKAALERQKIGLQGEGAARAFARIISAVSDDGRSVSENCFICTRVLTEIYLMTLSYEGTDVFIPPDRADCAAKLGKLCGGDKLSLISGLKKGGSFERTAYVMREYRKDMLEILQALGENSAEYARTFRRMYDDAGFWLGKYVRPADLIYLTALALPLMDRDSFAGAAADKGLINFLV